LRFIFQNSLPVYLAPPTKRMTNFSSAKSVSPLKQSPCDLCGSVEVQECFTAKDRLNLSEDSFRIVVCRGCGVLRTLPEMTETELAKFYPNDYWGGEPTEEWIQSSQADKTEFLKASNLAGGQILDVGCGAGFFLRALNAKNWERFGVEISPEAAQAAANVLGNARIFTGTIFDAALENEFFDTVAFWSALEHTNQPRAQLLEARRILKPGGTLIIQVPNAASYQAKYFKGDWFALDAPRHRYHFNLPTLNRALQDAEFEIYNTSFHSKVHNAHALRQSLKSKLWPSAFTRPLFLFSIPFLKPFDYYMSYRKLGATLTVAARAI
jgi:SAM-dependent methyltransferase